MRNFILIHPTRNRKTQAWETFYKWYTRVDVPGWVTYIFSVDTDDETMYELAFPGITFRGPHKNAVEAINAAAAEFVGPFIEYDNTTIIVVSDDFEAPEHWDTLLNNALEGQEDFLVKTQDGLQKTLITLPIMDKKYYERFGYIYNPDYSHMFCDQEMTAVGVMLDRVITLPIEFKHNHYSTGKSAKDAISLRNDATWKQGQDLFNERLKDNFGLTDIVTPYSEIKWR